MAGSYLPPIVQRLTADISEFVAKMEEAKAVRDEFEADTAANNEATRGGGGGGSPVAQAFSRQQAERDSAWGEHLASMKAAHGQLGSVMYSGAAGVSSDIDRAGTGLERVAPAAEKTTKQLGGMRQMLSGQLQNGLTDFASTLKSISGALASVDNGLGQFGKAGGTLASVFTGPLGLLGSVMGFAKTWAIMVPTLFAAPALLAAVGGAAGGLAGSFTVASTAIGIFAMGAMKDLGYITSVSNMAQYDALSAPLQRLYMAYHNLSNEFTIMSQTMGGNTTIISVLTGMFTTMGTVVSRLGPIMGEVASAGQSAFNVLSQGLLGPQFTQFINWVGAEATPVLTTFSQTFVNMASGWTGLMQDLTPAITLFDNGMVSLTATFANWANSPKGKAQVEGFINYVKDAWPQISHFWGGLGDIISKFFEAGSKGAPGMAQDLGNLFTTIANNIPTLVNFGENVLPGIVKGFSAFTGGFFQGLGQSLKALNGLSGPNWKSIGDTMGTITGELILLLPKVIEIAGWFVGIGNTIAKLPGGIGLIVGAWLTLKGVMAFGHIMAGLSAMLGVAGQIQAKFALTAASAESIGGASAAAGAGAAGGDIPAAGGLLGAGFVDAVVAPMALGISAAVVAGLGLMLLQHKNVGDLLNNHRNLHQNLTPGYRGLHPGDTGGLYQTQAQRTAALWASQYGEQNPNTVTSGIGKGDILGSPAWIAAIKANTAMLQSHHGIGSAATTTRGTSGPITIQSTNNINVAGPMSPEALSQLEAVLRQHDNVLVQRLTQTRGAYG